jgi:hypothetical protein
MTKTPRPVTKALAIVTKLIKGKSITKIPKQLSSPKGRVISSVLLRSQQFRKGLDAMFSMLKVDFTRLRPIHNVKEFYAILIEAHSRLKKKNIIAITPTALLGEWFQVFVEKHPAIIDLMNWASRKYVDSMNEQLASKNSRALTLNCFFDMIDVKKPFKKIVKIYDVRLKEPGHPKGREFIDLGMLASNADKQHLLMPMELKTRGAGGELPKQKAKFEERLMDSPEGTVMTFSIEGQPGVQEIALKDIVLIKDILNPKRSLEEDFLGRIGVIAGTKAIVRIAKDANGRPYIRVKLPFDSDLMRHLLEYIMIHPKLL